MKTLEWDINAKIRIELKDMYDLLIVECRYAYRRNNHLQPATAYDRVRRLIPLMYRANKLFAKQTLKQICTECIGDELMIYLPREDKFFNRRRSIEFVEWCMDTLRSYGETDWYPWNWDQFLRIRDK